MQGVVATPKVTPEQFSAVRSAFGKPMPGRVIVLYPIEAENEFIQVPGWVKRKEESLRDVPLEIRKVLVVSSGFDGIRTGDTIGVRCDAANMALDQTDLAVIPDGYEVRIYGVLEPVLGGDVDVIFFKVTA